MIRPNQIIVVQYRFQDALAVRENVSAILKRGFFEQRLDCVFVHVREKPFLVSVKGIHFVSEPKELYPRCEPDCC